VKVAVAAAGTLALVASWSCAAPSAPQAAAWEAAALRNADFEEGDAQTNCPRGWGCKMHANPHAYSFALVDGEAPSGKRSVCVTPDSKEPWAVLSQPTHDIPKGAKLRFSVALRVDGGSEKGVGPFIVAQGGAGQVIRHSQNVVAGAFGWQRLEIEFVVPAEATLLEYGVVFYLPQKACVDDARLEIRR